VELTVSVTINGATFQSTDLLTVTVLPGPPILDSLTPSSATVGEPGITLALTGGCFQQGATVYWNGSPRPTTLRNPGELQAVISADDLNPGGAITTILVTVVNGDGQVSNPLSFGIVEPSVGIVESSVAVPGAIATASTAPTVTGGFGAAVAVTNEGGANVGLLAATYETEPVGETVFKIDEGAFVDVQITGADENDIAAAHFYYPSSLTGIGEADLRLTYFADGNWANVLSSEGGIPLKETTDNLASTVSGGRLTVIFDNTSTPKITELSGTVFGMFDARPQIVAVTGPLEPLGVGGNATVGVSYVSTGTPDRQLVTFHWGDNSSTTVIPTKSGEAFATHRYTAPGVYSVGITVADPIAGEAQSTFQYVVVYPNGGFVTGGGWINSPAGAFTPDPAQAGKASFGFVSKYAKGANVPTGNTEFQFKGGELNFKSTEYQWLVVAGASARFKGSGTVNGQPGYGFMLTAIDGQQNGGGGYDRFRIKIWDFEAGDTVVYDNQAGTDDNADLADHTVLGNGSIVIHREK
jgi:hypothetical protein